MGKHGGMVVAAGQGRWSEAGYGLRLPIPFLWAVEQELNLGK